MADIEEPAIRADGLQLEEHRALQERFWSAQRVAWILFALILVCALLGLTGSGGPLSRTTISLDGGLIDYPRIARWETADQIGFDFEQGQAGYSIALSSSFHEQFEINAVQPQPKSWSLTSTGMQLQFEGLDAGTSPLIMFVTPLTPGFKSFDVALGAGVPSTISLVVLP